MIDEFAVSYTPVFIDKLTDHGWAFRIDQTTCHTTLYDSVTFPSGKPLFDGDTLFHLVPTQCYDYKQWHLFDVQAMKLSSRCSMTFYIEMFAKVMERAGRNATSVMFFVMHLLFVHRDYEDDQFVAAKMIDYAIRLNSSNWMYYCAQLQMENHYFCGANRRRLSTEKITKLLRDQGLLFPLLTFDDETAQTLHSGVLAICTVEHFYGRNFLMNGCAPFLIWCVTTLAYQWSGLTSATWCCHDECALSDVYRLRTRCDTFEDEPMLILAEISMIHKVQSNLRQPSASASTSSSSSSSSSASIVCSTSHSDSYECKTGNERIDKLIQLLFNKFPYYDHVYKGLLNILLTPTNQFMESDKLTMNQQQVDHCGRRAFQCARFRLHVQKYETTTCAKFITTAFDVMFNIFFDPLPVKVYSTLTTPCGAMMFRIPFSNDMDRLNERPFQHQIPITETILSEMKHDRWNLCDRKEHRVHEALTTWIKVYRNNKQYNTDLLAELYPLTFIYKAYPPQYVEVYDWYLDYLRETLTSEQHKSSYLVEYLTIQRCRLSTDDNSTQVLTMYFERQQPFTAMEYLYFFTTSHLRYSTNNAVLYLMNAFANALSSLPINAYSKLLRLELESTLDRLVNLCLTYTEESESDDDEGHYHVRIIPLHTFARTLGNLQYFQRTPRDDPKPFEQVTRSSISIRHHMFESYRELRERVDYKILVPWDNAYADYVSNQKCHVVGNIHRLSRLTLGNNPATPLSPRARCVVQAIITTMAGAFGNNSTQSRITSQNLDEIMKHASDRRTLRIWSDSASTNTITVKNTHRRDTCIDLMYTTFQICPIRVNLSNGPPKLSLEHTDSDLTDHEMSNDNDNEEDEYSDHEMSNDDEEREEEEEEEEEDDESNNNGISYVFYPVNDTTDPESNDL